jgi:hypothetical protein
MNINSKPIEINFDYEEGDDEALVGSEDQAMNETN